MEERKPETPHIEVAPQDVIDQYADTARRFFSEVLGMDADGCLLTDASELSDFSSCGLPETLIPGGQGLAAVYNAWDSWVLGELDKRYGVVYLTTKVPLVDLFRDLEEAWQRRTH